MSTARMLKSVVIGAIITLIGLVALVVLGVAWFFRPNMEIIQKDDVILWNRLRLGNATGVTFMEMDDPRAWGLVLEVDGHELRFDEEIDWDRMRKEATRVYSSPGPEWPEGTDSILWQGVRFYVRDDALLHIEINAIDVGRQKVTLRTDMSKNARVEFPGFGIEEATLLFGEPDGSHRFFMH